MPRPSSNRVKDILERAEKQHITAEELDVLVEKTRELSSAREQELKHLKALLQELESRQIQH